MGKLAGVMERFQVPLYLVALALGAAVGLFAPSVAAPAGLAITPVLGLLLYATFLGIPFAKIGEAIRNWRFLITVLVVNFALAPLIAWLLSRFVAHDRVLLVGVLFVLLTPCVDYVIVFTGLAGGAKDRLLAAAPLLMLLQLVLLPLYLWAFVGAEVVRVIDIAPFVEAFLLLIALPLVLAWLTQLAASRTVWGAQLQHYVLQAMVPLMMLTLAVVVASQIAGVKQHLASLLLAVPIYALFAVVMFALGRAVGRIAKLDEPGTRALMFSGATRNSLVVLPLALALPAAFDLVPLVIVTQTLVELLCMVLFVRLLQPRKLGLSAYSA